MTDRQNNSINMINAVYEVAQKFSAVWTSRTPFAAQVAVLQSVIADLNDPVIARGRDTTGNAADKTSYQLHAAAKADYIGDIIQAYALDQDNQTLYRSMMFGASDIMHIADAEAAAKLQEVYDTGTASLHDLAAYGLTQADLDALKADLDHFKAKMSAPRTATGEKKEAGEEINSLIRKAGDALHRMDKMINTFAAASPEFVSQYKSARIIVDLGHGAKKAATPTGQAA